MNKSDQPLLSYGVNVYMHAICTTISVKNKITSPKNDTFLKAFLPVQIEYDWDPGNHTCKSSPPNWLNLSPENADA